MFWTEKCNVDSDWDKKSREMWFLTQDGNTPLRQMKEVCFIPKTAGNHGWASLTISAATALSHPHLLSPEYDSVLLTAPWSLLVPLKVYFSSSQRDRFKFRSDRVTCLLIVNYQHPVFLRISSRVHLLTLTSSMAMFIASSPALSPNPLFPGSLCYSYRVLWLFQNFSRVPLPQGFCTSCPPDRPSPRYAHGSFPQVHGSLSDTHTSESSSLNSLNKRAMLLSPSLFNTILSFIFLHSAYYNLAYHVFLFLCFGVLPH